MRRLTAILLSLLLLLNVLGYYGMFLGFRHQHNHSLISQLDKGDYQSLETVTIKVPISLPYVLAEQDFQRVDGVFEHQGEFYRLVKQRLTQDTLHVVCVKDVQSKRISQALTDYVKSFTGQSSKGEQSGKMQVNFIKDYLAASFVVPAPPVTWMYPIHQPIAEKQFIPAYYLEIVLPPELA